MLVYRVALGTDPVTPKRREGDRATPEGSYRIAYKNPHSRFYRSLALDYPGRHDAARGLAHGLISRAQHDRIQAAHRARHMPPWNTALGGAIFIHGNGAQRDWTWGCIALDDRDMETLYHTVPVGTPVTILP